MPLFIPTPEKARFVGNKIITGSLVLGGGTPTGTGQLIASGRIVTADNQWWGSADTSGASAAYAAIGNSGRGLELASNREISWCSSTTLGSTRDTLLTRDAAGTLAQRDSTNAQAFRIYNTYTDASNYERSHMGWNSNTFEISVTGSGTGSVSRTILLLAGNSGAGNILYRAATHEFRRADNTLGFKFDSSGHLLAGTDNQVDIGATGATRPRAIYAAGLVRSAQATALTAGGAQVIGLGDASTPQIYAGSGAPSASAIKGSLYLRSDGSGINDRVYVNTNGSTTWTALVTVA